MTVIRNIIYLRTGICSTRLNWKCGYERNDEAMRENKYLNENERYVIEVELAAGTSKSEIARKLKRARCTIQREITRGLVEQMDGSTGETYLVYKADWAQKAAKRRWQAKGTALKIGHDFDTAETLERLIRDNKWSPDAALGYAIKNKLISTIITTPTLYSYIKAGVLSITEKDLPRQGAQRKKNKEIYRHAHHNIRGKSIEVRPKEASARNAFGHWEGDLIVGKKGTKTVCLTLVERMTRYVITRELPSKQAANVVNAFDYLEKCYGGALWISSKQSPSITERNLQTSRAWKNHDTSLGATKRARAEDALSTTHILTARENVVAMKTATGFFAAQVSRNQAISPCWEQRR